MCGICGIISPGKLPVRRELLEEMNSRLIHRGPDGEGFYINPGKTAGLAMRRLKVIDLDTGDQPIFNENRTVSVVLNGEIYNFLDIRKELEEKGHCFATNSDTEVLVHLYEEYGEGLLGHLRGMYAFAIWDENRKTLFCARDRLGKKPFYYTTINGVFYFSSEIKSLMTVPGFKKDINYSAIHYYLTCMYIPAPMTIWKDVYALSPANWLKIEGGGKMITRQYWELDFRKKTELSYEESKEKLRTILKEATRFRMISDVPLGAFLSGGIDSTVIVGLMSEMSSKPVKTFSIGFDDKEFSELKYARCASDKFSTEHEEFIVRPDYTGILKDIVWHYDQPYADCSALPSYYLAKVTRPHVTVALNGDGGDENFAGYLKYRAMLVSEKVFPVLRKLPEKIIKNILNRIPMNESVNARSAFRYIHRFLGPLYESPAVRNIEWRAYFTKELKTDLYSEEMKRLAGPDLSYDSQVKLFEEAAADDTIDRMLHSDIKSYLPDDLLVKMDVATMANSLETRSPLLDHVAMEFIASLPSEWKLRSGIFSGSSKIIFKDAFRHLLPDEIYSRGKQGFSIPLGKWFCGEFGDYARETLLSSAARRRPYFNMSEVEKIIDMHMSGRKDYGYCLWALLMLELWHEVFEV